MERIKNIYGKANLYKTIEDRLAVLSVYRRNLLKLLKEGYNPFGNNSVLHNTKKDQIRPETKPASQVSTVATEPIAPQTKKVTEQSPTIEANKADKMTMAGIETQLPGAWSQMA